MAYFLILLSGQFFFSENQNVLELLHLFIKMLSHYSDWH